VAHSVRSAVPGVVQPDVKHRIAESLPGLIAILAGALAALLLLVFRPYSDAAMLAPAFDMIGPTIAVGLLAAAGTMLLRNWLGRHVVQGVGICILTVGLVHLAAALVRARFGLDLSYFADLHPWIWALWPDQLGVGTSLALTILGGAALAADGSGSRTVAIAQACCLLIIVASVFSLFAHILGAISAHTAPSYDFAPLIAAITLLPLSASVMLLRPDMGVMGIIRNKGPTGSLARTGLIFVLLVPAVIGLVCALGERLGFYGASGTIVAQLFANAAAALMLLGRGVTLLLHSDSERHECERVAALSAARYRAAEQGAHAGQCVAEAASASKAAFLANMSHEIRTPMNGVMGFAELLLDSHLGAKQKRYAEMIRESAQTLLKLLNDILDVSKIEAGQLDILAEPTNVRRKIEQCLRLMQPLAEQKGLQLTSNFEKDFPEYVLTDGLRLRQILVNLLGNAVKFTPHGSISTSLRSSLAEDGSPTFLITVADTGVGIDADRMEAVFESFEQADVSISRRYGGSGLGLSISGRLCRLMGGSITLDSKEGEGTLVSIVLPLEATGPVSAVDDTLVGTEDIVPTLPSRSRSVLLVEDIDLNQELICEMLERLGCRVEVASNGAEALERVRRAAEDGFGWDLILMDIQMPVMDGLASTRAIRALGDRAASTPIVALTASAFAVEIQECRDAGMDDHIAKPVSLAMLGTALNRWIGEAGGTRSLSASDQSQLAERFDDRCHISAQRLRLLVKEIAAAGSEAQRPLLREAEELAHIIAGTAGMFGRPKLGTIANQLEQEMRLLSRSEGWLDIEPLRVPIARFIGALSRGLAAGHRESDAEDCGDAGRSIPSRKPQKKPRGMVKAQLKSQAGVYSSTESKPRRSAELGSMRTAIAAEKLGRAAKTGAQPLALSDHAVSMAGAGGRNSSLSGSAQAQPQAPDLSLPGTLFSGRRILVVEDEVLVAMVIENMLCDLGCDSVTVAATAEQALARIDAQDFDVAMLDMNLNGVVTFEVADALAARSVPFLFSTGSTGIPSNHAYADRPTLTKPYQYQQLAAMLSELLAHEPPNPLREQFARR